MADAHRTSPDGPTERRRPEATSLGAERPTLDDIYRAEAGRCTATLVRVLGDVDLAEDSVAEAFVIAADRWARDGIPPNPGGWITTTARNRAIDHLRRESTRDARHLAAHRLHDPEPTVTADLGDVDVVPDDQLRLLFLCCHPALAPDAQVALTLRLLGGLQTPEIARAFLVPEATMAPVLAAIYLIFNEGHTASTGGELTRTDLSDEAIRLGRLLVELLPDEPEARGLLALMLLTEARRAARTDADGALVRLVDQDRRRWDDSLIAEGHQLVRDCLQRNSPGSYQLQAAIAAVHADAPDAAATDWSQIVALYDHLLRLRPNAVVGLNRAIAVAELRGAAAGLAALDGLDLDGYHLYHAARAEMLARVGRTTDAVEAFGRAEALTTNDVERRHVAARRSATLASEHRA